jgi:hypothetical protein
MLEQTFLSLQSYKVPYSETYGFTNIFTYHPRVPHNEHILHSLCVYKNAEILTCRVEQVLFTSLQEGDYICEM